MPPQDYRPHRNERGNPLHRTVLCKYYVVGLCSRGEDCSFAHGGEELRSKPDLFRTGLCKSFSKKGICKNGDNCRFAHTRNQLRRPSGSGSGLPGAIAPPSGGSLPAAAAPSPRGPPQRPPQHPPLPAASEPARVPVSSVTSVNSVTMPGAPGLTALAEFPATSGLAALHSVPAPRLSLPPRSAGAWHSSTQTQPSPSLPAPLQVAAAALEAAPCGPVGGPCGAVRQPKVPPPPGMPTLVELDESCIGNYSSYSYMNMEPMSMEPMGVEPGPLVLPSDRILAPPDDEQLELSVKNTFLQVCPRPAAESRKDKFRTC